MRIKIEIHHLEYNTTTGTFSAQAIGRELFRSSAGIEAVLLKHRDTVPQEWSGWGESADHRAAVEEAVQGVLRAFEQANTQAPPA